MAVKYTVATVPTVDTPYRGLPFVTDLLWMQERYKKILLDIEHRITKDKEKRMPAEEEDEWRVGWLLSSQSGIVPWFMLKLKKDRTLLVFPGEVKSGDAKVYFECEFKDDPALERKLSEQIPF